MTEGKFELNPSLDGQSLSSGYLGRLTNLEKPQFRTPRLRKSSPEKYKQSFLYIIKVERSWFTDIHFSFLSCHIFKAKLFPSWTRIFTFLQGSVLYLRPEKKQVSSRINLG